MTFRKENVKHKDVVGEYRLGKRNDGCDGLARFCQVQGIVTIVLFKLHARRSYTLKFFADSNKINFKYLINYRLMNKR